MHPKIQAQLSERAVRRRPSTFGGSDQRSERSLRAGSDTHMVTIDAPTAAARRPSPPRGSLSGDMRNTESAQPPSSMTHSRLARRRETPICAERAVGPKVLFAPRFYASSFKLVA